MPHVQFFSPHPDDVEYFAGGALLRHVVYLPEATRRRSLYWHRDHLSTGRLVAEAARSTGLSLRLRHYHSGRPNLYLDVEIHFAESLAALRQYRSQYAATASPPFLLHFGEAIRRLLTKAWGRRAGCRRAEAFREETIGEIESSGGGDR